MKISATFSVPASRRAMIHAAMPEAELCDPSQWGLPKYEVADSDVLAPYLRDCDVVVTTWVIPESVKSAPRMKWLHSLNAGVDMIVGPWLAQRPDLLLTNSSGVHARRMSEYVIGMILYQSLQLGHALRNQERHKWTDRSHYWNHDKRVRETTIGILGYGSVGRETARLAKAFGMEILAFKRNPHQRQDGGFVPKGLGDPQGLLPARWYGPGQLREMLPDCDYVAIALPLTPYTNTLLGREEIASMKQGAFVINVGRGEIIDQDAMAAAIRSGQLSGAGLDVTTPEPLNAENDLWDVENVYITPHVSGLDLWSEETAWDVLIENFKRYAQGQPLINLVDHLQGY